MMRFAQNHRLKKSGAAAATGRIRLQDIHRAGREHAFEISNVVTVLAGRDVHPGRAVVAHHAQAWQIVGGNGFFEPADVEFRKGVSKFECLFPRIGSVRVDEELRSPPVPQRPVRCRLAARDRLSFSPE